MNHGIDRSRGFTLIELIVVIAIIGILATISLAGLGRYQADARDARRASSASVIAEALEKYYDINGEYPSCSAVISSTATKDTLMGVDAATIISPQAAPNISNSIKCTSDGNVLSVNGVDFFEYQGDGSAECNGNNSCLSFALKYKNETNGQIKIINSRRSTSIATSGIITNLVANPTGFSTIGLTWGSVNNATGYVIQKSTDTGFVGGLVQTSSPTAGATISGLSPGVKYYFRVAPANGVDQGSWSNTASATTLSLVTPVATATANSSSQVTISWPTVQYATSYTVARSTSNTFPTGGTTLVTTQAAGSGAQTKVYTDESPGLTHYYRVQATATGDTSDWSAVVSMTTAATPAAFTISKTDPQYNLERVTSNAVCAAGTTAYYQWFKNGASWTEGSGSSYSTVDAYFPQWNYTLTITNQVRCQTATYQSSYVAATNSVSRTLSAPTSDIGNTSYRAVSWNWTCPAGTTSYSYSWNVTGNVNTSGSGSGGAVTSGSGSYSNQSAGWGSGRAYFTINCSSPAPYGWGTISDSSQGGFGPGCLPMTGSCPP